MIKRTKNAVLRCWLQTLCLSSLCGAAALSAEPKVRIVHHPQDQLVPVGATVTFSVVAMAENTEEKNSDRLLYQSQNGPPVTSVHHQWRFNNVDIAGANASTYTIPSVNFINVGAYDVQVGGSPTNTSKKAYLSVYTVTSSSDVNGGTLGTPIGAYSSQSFTCPSGGTFSKGFCVTNNQGTPAFFTALMPVPNQTRFRTHHIHRR